MSRWVWDLEMPEVLVADQIGLGKAFTLVAEATICKFSTKNVVVALPWSMLWGNTLDKWVDMAQNDYPWNVRNAWEQYLLQGMNAAPHCHVQYQSTLSLSNPELISAHEPILIVTVSRAVLINRSVGDEITYLTTFKLMNILVLEGRYFSDEDLISCIEKPENWCNIILLSHTCWFNKQYLHIWHETIQD